MKYKKLNVILVFLVIFIFVVSISALALTYSGTSGQKEKRPKAAPPPKNQGSFCMPSGSVPTPEDCYNALQDEANPCQSPEVLTNAWCTSSGQACFGSGGAGFMCTCGWTCK
jgi:hypothetical protein